MKLSLVSKRYPNNTNLNSTNITTTKREKEAVVAVNFKKLKEKGNLSASTCACTHADRCSAQAEERMRLIRERMVELDFREEFIEKILKEYSTKKIDEKLDLLMERKNIQNPAGWLSAALKNDYQDPQSSLSFPRKRESIKPDEEPVKESENDKCRGVLPYAPPPNVIARSDLSERGNLNSQIPSPLEGEGQGEGDKILSTEETRERFHFLRDKLMAMKSP